MLRLLPLLACAAAGCALDRGGMPGPSLWGGVARFEQEGREIAGEYGMLLGAGLMAPGQSGFLGAAGTDIDWRHGSGGKGKLDVVHLCYVERLALDRHFYIGGGVGTVWSKVEDERVEGAPRKTDEWSWGMKAVVGIPFAESYGVEVSWLATEPVAGVTTTGFNAVLKLVF